MVGGLRVAGSGRRTAVITRHCGGLKNNLLDGTDVPPPPMTMCTVPLLVSITSVAGAAGAGVRGAFASRPRIRGQRSEWGSWPHTTRSTPYRANNGTHF